MIYNREEWTGAIRKEIKIVIRVEDFTCRHLQVKDFALPRAKRSLSRGRNEIISILIVWLSFLYGSAYEGILKSGIEVKAVSDECLAKSVAVP